MHQFPPPNVEIFKLHYTKTTFGISGKSNDFRNFPIYMVRLSFFRGIVTMVVECKQFLKFKLVPTLLLFTAAF